MNAVYFYINRCQKTFTHGFAVHKMYLMKLIQSIIILFSTMLVIPKFTKIA